ncbi:MAG: PEP-CTERM sorting domain-containing protein [Candidatus Desantisbacteria bacterium]
MKIIKILLVMLFIGVKLAEAIPIVSMEYIVTSAGVNVWQYNYTINVSSSSPESVWLTDLIVPCNVYDITVPANWDTIAGPGFVEWYSIDHTYDIMPGSMLSGFGYRIIQPSAHGNLTFYASGSTINTGLPTPGQSQGQTTPIPEPATIILLGMGLFIMAYRNYSGSWAVG